jgi:hypothetical protein
MVTSFKELGREKDYTGVGQQHIKKTPVLSSERVPHNNKTITVKE